MDLAGAGIYSPAVPRSDIRVVVFGSTGYIGRYVTKELIAQGYAVVAVAREKKAEKAARDFAGARRIAVAEVTDVESVRAVFKADDAEDGTSPFAATVTVSCMASRGGGLKDSNLVDYQATLNALEANIGPSPASASKTSHFVLLSAVCVQKPLLEFQRAKLKFEEALQAVPSSASDKDFSYSIVRPTAFFKSLAGQIARMQTGASYIMFGDGELSKCNPISERDLARFMAACIKEEQYRNKVLPVGGPGEPVTPKEQARMIFEKIGKPEKLQSVPIGLMDVVIGAIDAVGKVVPLDSVKDAAEFGRIGKYYATEDMIGPSYGEDTLEAFFEDVAKNGLEGQELGEAAIF